MKAVIKHGRFLRGGYAAGDIKKGERVLRFNGRIYTALENPRGINAKRNHFLQVGVDTFMGPSRTVDNYINHSSEPNSAVIIEETGIFLDAIKDIRKGEEITFDYSTTMVQDEWEMECLCRRINCRKIIREFVHLSEALRKKYKRHQMVPQFVQKFEKKKKRK